MTIKRLDDSADVGALRDSSRTLWDQNAVFWDEQQGDAGNATQRLLVGPATERLLMLRAGETVLDLACGTGTMARRMADRGARVLAADFSAGMLERAHARSTAYGDRIDYRQVDATDEHQLLALGVGRFDAAVCNMAFMDMPAIQPALDALSRLLKPGGRFVFSVLHPCFNGVGVRKTLAQEDRDGQIVEQHALTITYYITPTVSRGRGIVGQPEPHYSFDRPLSALFGACFAAGFILDGLEEPTFDEASSAESWYSWANFKEFPLVLVARLRPADRK
jgi:2-polyprenyl-3-methyl-5-hydroxy-6-metoxy-1,4-benzoquinol methylase